MLDTFTHPDAWVAFLTLTLLEIVLGIDNVIFIAILTEKLPREQQKLAYRLGLGGALVSRVGLLFAISWVMHLTTPLFTLFDHEMTGRHLILLGGGLFLIAKSAYEIYEKVEIDEEEEMAARGRASLAGTVGQIMILDIVFSLDSVITAVGMVEEIEIMIAAVIIAVAIMLIFARSIGNFVNRHPSMKLLALAFLLLIGVLLTGEGFGQHIGKGYIYFAMGFAVLIEFLNMRFRTKHAKVKANRPPEP